jgi:Uncharacterised nucleotidyltransferase
MNGLLPLLRGAAIGRTEVGTRGLEPALIRYALAAGLGPVLWQMGGGSDAWAGSPFADEIRAADLTARIVTATKYEVLESILEVLAPIDCRPVLLKGVATALRYYASPHLRTMGDIDLLVPANQRDAAEAELRSLGFTQRSHQPAAAFVRRHHSMPFWHPQRDIWIDVHTHVYPLQYLLAADPRFSVGAMTSQLSEIAVGKHIAQVMCDELQLVYTSTRWAERFDADRGLYPVLDAARLLHVRGEALDWDVICARVKGSWAITALHVLLESLRRWELATVPGEILAWLAANDAYSNRASIAVLHRVFTQHVMEGHPYGLLLTRHTLEITWATLVQPARPIVKLASLPYFIVSPPARLFQSRRRPGQRILSLIRRIC